eukprot:110485-Chlamydomonas_euryale.AAC.2
MHALIWSASTAARGTGTRGTGTRGTGTRGTGGHFPPSYSPSHPPATDQMRACTALALPQDMLERLAAPTFEKVAVGASVRRRCAQSVSMVTGFRVSVCVFQSEKLLASCTCRSFASQRPSPPLPPSCPRLMPCHPLHHKSKPIGAYLRCDRIQGGVGRVVWDGWCGERWVAWDGW